MGSHIMLSEDGPWVERGPPTITRELTIVGSCAAINSRGGARCYFQQNMSRLWLLLCLAASTKGRMRSCFWPAANSHFLECAGLPLLLAFICRRVLH